MVMKEDLARMEYTPGNYYNFHPGNHVGQGAQKGIALIAEMLNGILTEEQSTTVLLETMAGKGSEVGRSFEELREILDRVEKKEKSGVEIEQSEKDEMVRLRRERKIDGLYRNATK